MTVTNGDEETEHFDSTKTRARTGPSSDHTLADLHYSAYFAVYRGEGHKVHDLLVGLLAGWMN